MSLKNEERYYVEGNAVRKINTAPQRKEQPKRQQQRKVNKKIQRNSQRARAFDLGYTVALVTATALLFVSCVMMLTMQARVTEQRRKISVMESNLNELTDMNDETGKQLESSVDLTQIYDVATRELGMVYPSNGQVISYEASKPDYVKQMKDVPTD